MEAKTSTRDLGRRALEVESNSVLVATIALIVFIGIMHPDFLAWGQLKEVVQNAVYVGIIAAGMAFLISMREIDLSVGSMFGLSLVVSALLMQDGMNPWLAALLGHPARLRDGAVQRGARPVHRDPGDRRDARDPVDVPRALAGAQRRRAGHGPAG